MPVPKRRRSHARRNKREANKNIAFHGVAKCQTCQEIILPHQACSACGYYKGEKVIRTKSERMFERGKARQQASSYQSENASSAQ